METKTCTSCKQKKPISDFYKADFFMKKRDKAFVGYKSQCKKCLQAKRRARLKYNPEKRKHRALRDNFGIGLDEYKQMLLKQRGVCAICGKPETATYKGKLRYLSVDHNHSTGTIRGLLCNDCNVALGWFHEDIEVLKKAINYLGFWQKKEEVRINIYHTTI